MIIGILGRARSGKSTVASNLVRLATTMNHLQASQYDIGQEVLDFCISSGRLHPKKREELLPHELHTLVLVGKQKREEEPDFWLDKIGRRMCHEAPDVAVIPNVRYTNEADFVRQHGGYLIRVVALNPNGSEYISPDRDANHESETELLGVRTDFTLTAYKGEPDLLADYAFAVFNQIRRKENG